MNSKMVLVVLMCVLSATSGAMEEVEESRNFVRSIEMGFDDEVLMQYASEIETEDYFDKLPKAEQKKILSSYSEFRKFLQINEAVGKKLPVESQEVLNDTMTIRVNLDAPTTLVGDILVQIAKIPYVTIRYRDEDEKEVVAFERVELETYTPKQKNPQTQDCCCNII